MNINHYPVFVGICLYLVMIFLCAFLASSLYIKKHIYIEHRIRKRVVQHLCGKHVMHVHESRPSYHPCLRLLGFCPLFENQDHKGVLKTPGTDTVCVECEFLQSYEVSDLISMMKDALFEPCFEISSYSADFLEVNLIRSEMKHKVRIHVLKIHQEDVHRYRFVYTWYDPH